MIKVVQISKTAKGYNVRLSNDSELFLSGATKEEFLLYSGKELTNKDVVALTAFEESVKPLMYSTNLLAKHNYSTYMLKTKLRAKKVSEEVIDSVIKRLVSARLLDDNAYAKERANYLINTKNAAKKYIINDLRAKGINKFLIEDTLALYDEFDTQKLMLIIPKLLVKHNKLSHQKAREKVSAKLMRDGFAFTDIKSALSAFDFEDFINEDENLTRDFAKLTRNKLPKTESNFKLVYNKLVKAGYPIMKVKTILEGNNYED